MNKHLINCYKKSILTIALLATTSYSHAFSEPMLADADSQSDIYRPSITNTSWEDTIREEAVYSNPYSVSLFSAENGEDKARLWSQTTSVAAYGVGFAGFLALLPSEITNWEKSDERLHEKWWDNVKSGPVWDRDHVAINYIGHPYFGGVYYQAARKSGYRQWDSFMYSFLMSTFYWEYGVEAFAETPSIQDLVVTPVLGWVYGEWAFHKEREIIQRGGTIWGSERLGDTALFFLDPIDSLGRGVNNLFGSDVIKAGTGYMGLTEVQLDNGRVDKQLQLQVQYSIGAGSANTGVGRHHNGQYQHIDDPVHFGIVGFSAGSSYLSPNKTWEIEAGWVPSATLGLYFTRNFSTRLSYARGELTEQKTSQKVTFENYSLDSQYYFNGQNTLRPYLTAGIGESMREMDRNTKTFQVNAGVGAHYRLSANWALQLDWQNHYSAKHSSSDKLVTGQLVYRFGQGEGWL
ncbi:DUF3943 domain-containing protein [Shewanella sp. UCD-KL12]|uniref:DUF3943 domain-containing protein n=1 Tax=Shewanella sp. UCD-KL12 TaxID=1917163 RepID=UPI000970F58B|nr:DUF3943 domain-containing protein [Shewanella sp. UCD-KL12]